MIKKILSYDTYLQCSKLGIFLSSLVYNFPLDWYLNL